LVRNGARLTGEALAIRDELQALRSLSHGGGEAAKGALRIADGWDGPTRQNGLDAQTGLDRGTGVPPGGAAFANIRALAKVAAKKRSDGTIKRTDLSAIAFELADALQYDPRNDDVLHNLAVMFRCSGDEKRAQLAADLAAE
jgi:hypothetical protein